MNTQEYIESGILEAYVLGALSEAERAEVEANIALYPEVAGEVAAIEDAMRQFAEAGAKMPPVFMEEKIWSALSNDQVSQPVAQPAAPSIIPLTPAVSRPVWQRAAVWVALAGSLLVNLMLWYQRNDSKQQQLAMQQQLDTMKASQQQLAEVVKHYRDEKEMTADTSMQTIVMHTMKKGHPMAATIYWSKTNGDAYLAIDKLPEPPKGMQYQLWVIQSGKPVDMGILPNALIASAGMKKIAMQVTNGEAFAISLEKEGGSPTPTMENIYVLGKAS